MSKKSPKINHLQKGKDVDSREIKDLFVCLFLEKIRKIFHWYFIKCLVFPVFFDKNNRTQDFASGYFISIFISAAPRLILGTSSQIKSQVSFLFFILSSCCLFT